jgi:cobyrinic acid a,c-diamide synthase
VRIGYIRDAAFTFYYPENLEALEAAGATLVPVSALYAAGLPPNLAALYIGGGFPEMHAAALADNRRFLDSLCAAAAAGLPVYAECGGLMLLSRAIRWRAAVYPMAGVLACETEVSPAPQGHGYVRLTVDGPNPFFAPGATLGGHEFHYSRIVGEAPATACAVTRGTGCAGGRDAVVAGNVWASYSHVHALATPEWAPALVAAARRYAGLRLSPAAG